VIKCKQWVHQILPSSATVAVALVFLIVVEIPVAGGSTPAGVGSHQVAWVHLIGASPAPKARQYYGMTYDPKIGALVLFGGLDTYGNVLGDTWEFKAGTWSHPHFSVSPTPRAYEGFAYDPALGGILLFGGQGTSGLLNDMWLFTASGWHELHPSVAPPPEGAEIMLYDTADQYILLIRVGQQVSPLPAVWTFARGKWSNITATVGPTPPAVWMDGSDNPAGGDVLLFGGSQGCGMPAAGVDLTWTYAHGRFTNVTGSQKIVPQSALPSLAMGYDPTLGGVVMFSGYTLDCQATHTTYLFRDGIWSNLTSVLGHSPPPRWNARLVYLPHTGAVLFSGNENRTGGSNDLDPDTWALTAEASQGDPTSAG
jgi:hypothetical protein